jgi:hypothetical protein
MTCLYVCMRQQTLVLLLHAALLPSGWATGQDLPVPTTAVPVENAVVEGEDPPNVNARYTIERVVLKYDTRYDVKRDAWAQRDVSRPLQAEIDQVVGQNLDQSRLEGLAQRLKKELHVPEVKVRVSKGREPDRVIVTLEAGDDDRGVDVDLDVTRFLYHSKQGWTGEGDFSLKIHGNRLSLGLVSDGDRLMERYAGIQASFERRKLGTERLGLRFRFNSYHQQWNRTTLEMAAPGALYRTRQHFIPELMVRLAEPLELTVGFDFARYRTFLPNPVVVGFLAPRTESSNAAVTTLRYRQRWNSDSGYRQEVVASYSLRKGLDALNSDALFTRQTGDVRYTMKRGHQTVKVAYLAGNVNGNAPFYERLVLGNMETLRGWNKFDVNPLGSSRVVHGSIDYSYHAFLLFYDTGAAWEDGVRPEQKQSLGVGLRSSDGDVQLAVGFPVRTGHANPVVYFGFNF